MKLTIALIFLSSAALSQEPRPLDFDWRKIESIWAAPHLQPALKRISERYNVSQQANIESRIVGGKIAKPGQFPFHVLIILDKNYWCGGSLLNADYVLTAAHCVHEMAVAEVYSVEDLDIGHYWNSTSRTFIKHEKYDPETIINDIALIKLDDPALVSPNTNYIDLPRNHSSSTFAGEYATIQGFGRTSDRKDEELPHQQRWVTVPIIENRKCASTWGDDVITSQLCVDTKNGRGACFGDSGGGLFIGNVDIHCGRQIVGIVSYGAVSCERGIPDVFTRVSSFINWIDYQIN